MRRPFGWYVRNANATLVTEVADGMLVKAAYAADV